jgi:hypothetical protein
MPQNIGQTKSSTSKPRLAEPSPRKHHPTMMIASDQQRRRTKEISCTPLSSQLKNQPKIKPPYTSARRFL